jgi:hypothetical protein
LYPSWRVLSDHRNPVDCPIDGSVISNVHIHQGSFSLLVTVITSWVFQDILELDHMRELHFYHFYLVNRQVTAADSIDPGTYKLEFRYRLTGGMKEESKLQK